jgi:hypothetical protein
MLLSKQKGDFYSGSRKIHRRQSLGFTDLKDDLSLADCGYTRSKLTMLTKHYVHAESRDSALAQWQIRLGKGKYGSVGFSCYNHTIKGHGNLQLKSAVGTVELTKPSRASIMGPCIQSICLTALEKGDTHVDIFYRTTEIFKKFPADLVLIRDVLLKDFYLPCLQSVNFYFANVTCHPMYFVTLIPLLNDPVRELKQLKLSDDYFHDWVVKWTARYVCDEYHRGIAKFAQAMRTCKDARERIDSDKMKVLQKYLRDNHPGHRNDYVEDELQDVS